MCFYERYRDDFSANRTLMYFPAKSINFIFNDNNYLLLTGAQNEATLPTGSLLINNRGQFLSTLELNNTMDEYLTTAED